MRRAEAVEAQHPPALPREVIGGRTPHGTQPHDDDVESRLHGGRVATSGRGGERRGGTWSVRRRFEDDRVAYGRARRGASDCRVTTVIDPRPGGSAGR